MIVPLHTYQAKENAGDKNYKLHDVPAVQFGFVLGQNSGSPLYYPILTEITLFCFRNGSWEAQSLENIAL